MPEVDTPVEIDESDKPEELAAAFGQVPTPSVSDDIARSRENTRSWFAFGVLALLAGAVLLSFVLAWRGLIGSDVVIQTTVPSLMTLAGTVIGFYFGKEKE